MYKILTLSLSQELEAKYKPLSREEEIVAIRKAKLGDSKAINELVYSQIKMIVSVAKGYASHKNHVDDLINDGVTGLIEKIQDFDESYNVCFYTYIARHVTNAISYRVYDGDVVRMPRNESKKKTIQPKYDADGYILKEGVERKSVIGVSIDAPVNSNENAPTFESFIVDADNNTPEQECSEKNVSSLVRKMLFKLSDDERKIVSMAYGFDCYEVMTFQEIGDAMGKSKQAVYMQLAKVLERIKPKASAILA